MSIEFVDSPTTPLPYCVVRWHMKDGTVKTQFVDSRGARASTLVSDLKNQVGSTILEEPSINYAEVLQRELDKDGDVTETLLGVEKR